MGAKYRIRFFPDWGSGPLWCGNDAALERFGCGPICLSDLPLSDEVCSRICELCSWHSESLNWHVPEDPGPFRQAECDRFNQAVLKLVERIQKELGPDYEVVNACVPLKEDPELDAYLEDYPEFRREPRTEHTNSSPTDSDECSSGNVVMTANSFSSTDRRKATVNWAAALLKDHNIPRTWGACLSHQYLLRELEQRSKQLRWGRTPKEGFLHLVWMFSRYNPSPHYEMSTWESATLVGIASQLHNIPRNLGTAYVKTKAAYVAAQRSASPPRRANENTTPILEHMPRWRKRALEAERWLANLPECQKIKLRIRDRLGLVYVGFLKLRAILPYDIGEWDVISCWTQMNRYQLKNARERPVQAARWGEDMEQEFFRLYGLWSQNKSWYKEMGTCYKQLKEINLKVLVALNRILEETPDDEIVAATHSVRAEKGSIVFSRQDHTSLRSELWTYVQKEKTQQEAYTMVLRAMTRELRWWRSLLYRFIL